MSHVGAAQRAVDRVFRSLEGVTFYSHEERMEAMRELGLCYYQPCIIKAQMIAGFYIAIGVQIDESNVGAVYEGITQYNRDFFDPEEDPMQDADKEDCLGWILLLGASQRMQRDLWEARPAEQWRRVCSIPFHQYVYRPREERPDNIEDALLRQREKDLADAKTITRTRYEEYKRKFLVKYPEKTAAQAAIAFKKKFLEIMNTDLNMNVVSNVQQQRSEFEAQHILGMID